MRHSTVAHAKAKGFGTFAPGCLACEEIDSRRCDATYPGIPGIGRCIRKTGHVEVFCKDANGNYWIGVNPEERSNR